MKKRIFSFLIACTMLIGSVVFVAPEMRSATAHAAEYTEGTNQWTLPMDWKTTGTFDDNGWELAVIGNWSLTSFADINDPTSIRNNASSAAIGTGVNDKTPYSYIESKHNRAKASAIDTSSFTNWYVNYRWRWQGVAFSRGDNSTYMLVSPMLSADKNNPTVVFTAPEDGIYSYSELVTGDYFVTIDRSSIDNKTDTTYGQAVLATATVRKNGVVLNTFTPDSDNTTKTLEGTIALEKGDYLMFSFKYDGNGTIDDYEPVFKLGTTVVKKIGDFEYYKQIDHTPVFTGDSATSTSGNVTLKGYDYENDTFFDVVMATHPTDSNIWFANDPDAKNSWDNTATPDLDERLLYKHLWGGAMNGKITKVGGSHENASGAALVFTAPNNGTYSFSAILGYSKVSSNSNFMDFIIKVNGSTVFSETNYRAAGTYTNSDSSIEAAWIGELKKGDEVVILKTPNANASKINVSANSTASVKITEIRQTEFIEDINLWTLPMDWGTGLDKDANGWDLPVKGNWRLSSFGNLSDPVGTVNDAASDAPISDYAGQSGKSGIGPASYIESVDNRAIIVGSPTTWYVNNYRRWKGGVIFRPATVDGGKALQCNPYNHAIGIVFTAPMDGLYSYSELVKAVKFEFDSKPIVMTATVRKNGVIHDIFIATANDPTATIEGTIALNAGDTLVFGIENTGVAVADANENNIKGGGEYFGFYVKGIEMKIISDIPADYEEKTWELPTDWTVTDKKNADGWELPIKGNFELRSYPKSTAKDAFLSAPVGVNNTEASTGSPQPWLAAKKYSAGISSTGWYLNHNGKYSEVGGAIKCSVVGGVPRVSLNVHNGALAVAFTAPEDGVYSYTEGLNARNIVSASGATLSTVATVRKITSEGQIVLCSFTSSTLAPSYGVLDGKVPLKKGEVLLFTFDNARNTYPALYDTKDLNGDTDVKDEGETSADWDRPHDYYGFYITNLNVKCVDSYPAKYKEIDHTPIFDGKSAYDGSGNTKIMGYNPDTESFFDLIMVKSADGTQWMANDPDAQNSDANYKFLWKGTVDGGIFRIGGSHKSKNAPAMEFTAPEAGTYVFYLDIGKNWNASNTVYNDYKLVKEDGTVLYENSNYQSDGLQMSQRSKTLYATTELTKGEKVYFYDLYNENSVQINLSSDGPATLKITQIVPEFTETVDVEITWGSMEFDYYEGDLIWNESTHKWEADPEGKEAGWNTAAKNSNRVTVVNNGNVPVSGSVSYASSAEYSTIAGTFTDGESDLTSTVTFDLGAFGWNRTLWLELSGALDENTTDPVVLGTITVTLSS